MTNAPTVLNLFHNIDFVFQCKFPFTDRYAGEEDFLAAKRQTRRRFVDTNFVRDVRSYELPERSDRGAGEKGS